MSLLTHDEYKAIAASLQLPSNTWIDGAYRPAISGKTLETLNPATGKVIGTIPACEKADVDFAVAKAREAFEDGRWSRLHPGARNEVLVELSKLITRNAHELAVMESLDSGKTIYDCENVDVPETAHVIEWHGELIDKIYDQVSPASNDHIAMVVREPVGVVGLVIPWNFPLLMLAWKIGPALASGCSVVVKPAAETSLTALRIAELAAEAGLPRGVLNIVTGMGVDAGEALGRHPDVDMVSFTGSMATGRRFLNYSAESNLKEVVLELGGKNPCIVLDDAEDLDAVAAHVVNGVFWNMGQNCSAASRLIVQKGVKDKLLQKLKVHAREWIVGEPLNPEVRVGALISTGHFDKVCRYMKLAQGEEIVMGGKVVGQGFIEPTIVAVNDRNSALVREEVFGPLLTVITVGTFEEAISVANDTEYGLAASIFSANGKRALRGARMLRAGTVTVNSFGEGDITTPFGGYKQSGFGGRDNSIHAHDQYTQLKTIWLHLTDSSDMGID